MLRIVVFLVLMIGPASAAPKVGEHVGSLGPSGTEQTPAFILTDEYRSDYDAAKKCPRAPRDGDTVSIGQKAVYADDPKQGVVVLLDEYARRYAIDYCW